MAAIGLTIKKSPKARQVLSGLLTWLTANGHTPLLDPETACYATRESLKKTFEEISAEADFIVALGGDGTLLALARHLTAPLPVIAVNLGRLGFIAEIKVEELYPTIEDFIAGKLKIQRRIMLKGAILRDNKVFFSFEALNEIIISREASRILRFVLKINGAKITTYAADGLIVATPTGSTAYSLSAGGPIVFPDQELIVITPICPHTLSNRPLIISSSEVIELYLSENNEVILVADGQVSTQLAARDIVRIERAPKPLNLVLSPKRTYFEILSSKLGWGGS